MHSDGVIGIVLEHWCVWLVVHIIEPTNCFSTGSISIMKDGPVLSDNVLVKQSNSPDLKLAEKLSLSTSTVEYAYGVGP